MKNKLLIVLSFLTVLSCTTEDDENLPIDLTPYDDFVMELRIYYDDAVGETAKYEVTDFFTDGRDELISNTSVIEKNITSATDSTQYTFRVKEYKKVGVIISADQNIKAFRWRIYEEDFFISPFFSASIGVISNQSFPNPNKAIRITFDFDGEENIPLETEVIE